MLAQMLFEKYYKLKIHQSPSPHFSKRQNYADTGFIETTNPKIYTSGKNLNEESFTQW